MTKYILITIAFAYICLLGCKDPAEPSAPIPCDVLPCDTCDTYSPMTPGDSLYHNIPRSWYTIDRVVYNPHRSELIGHFERRTLRTATVSGVFIYNVVTKKTDCLNLWGYCLFSDGQRMIIEYPGWNGLGIYDFTTQTHVKLTLIPDKFVSPSLSLDEQYIFADSAHRTFKITIDGSKREALTDSLTAPVQLDDKHIIGVSRLHQPREGIRTLNLETKEMEWIDFSGLPNDMNWGFSRNTFSLSPDRTRILMDVASEKGIYYRENGGVYLLDLKTRTARNVLKKQYWHHQYYPRWSSNSTFFASYHCRKDTTAMLFEYDLNGKVLRQVTFKEMKLYP